MTIEVDHFFVAIPHPSAGSDALREAGFREGPSRDHPGQGTASRGVFFENAYLELIWLSDVEEAESALIARTGLRERTKPRGNACPFGIALRGVKVPWESLPFSAWEYRPPYVPENTFIPVGVNSENLREPLLFLLPWRTEPGWEKPKHPCGARRVTALSMRLGGTGPYSPEVTSLVQTGVLDLASGREYLMEVALDGGGRKKTLDLRPEVPLVLKW